MKKFAGLRPLPDIIRDARAQGVIVEDKHHERGGDHVGFVSATRTSFARVTFNTHTGVFFGSWARDDPGAKQRFIKFSSSDSEHEKTEWFRGLLAFFYVEKGQPAEVPMGMVAATLGGIRNAR